MTTVVFAGVQGSGKTVLLSVLATQKNKSLISPLNEAAGQFYADARKAFDSGKWPAPTNPLAQTEPLKWNCRFEESKFKFLDSLRRYFPTHLVYVDHAGEAWRWFTTKYQDNKDPAQDSNIPEQSLKNMEDQFATANGVCLVLDMEKDIDNPETGNIEQQLFVCATLNFLKKIGKDNIPIGVVITKCSDNGRYNQKDAEDAFSLHYKDIFQNRLWNNYEPIYTDAVANTNIGNDGKPYPEKNFTSSGMDRLLSWIAKITSPWREIFVYLFWGLLIIVLLPVISGLFFFMLLPIVIIFVIISLAAAKKRCSFIYYTRQLLIKIFQKGK